MRTEGEMLDLILGTARDDPRIRAVIMNGSRVNSAAPRDIFQDFDIVCLVADVIPFKDDRLWIKRFGETMVMQMPEEMGDPPPQDSGTVVYLMQFMDGHRIDLGIYPLSRLDDVIADSLSVVLLDKDGIVPPLRPPDESSYLPKPPTSGQYADCCNEFWWCAPYVAKGLWREQITYARGMFEQTLRGQLMKMLTWYVGIEHGFSANPGYLGKRLHDFLPPDLWALLLGTYSDAGLDHTWDSLQAMTDLFRRVAVPVGEYFGLEYPRLDDARVSAHLKHVRTLPRDAKQMY